ncbi:MAG: hypothetical protein EPO28_17860 [Saprospiraceae bacterium]|nr:MAG: hypothetical protein EPO28_17860 [Saprospiraceae bacterium]
MADATGFFIVTITAKPDQYRVNLAITLQCHSCKLTKQTKMNTVKHIHGNDSLVSQLKFMRNIHGVQVRDLITKFFYRNNHLCFHIILEVDSGEKIPYQEFTDYAEYKRIFTELQQQKGNEVLINFPEKNANADILSKIVA